MDYFPTVHLVYFSARKTVPKNNLLVVIVNFCGHLYL